ncbi:MAG TPA: hypothetical protein VFZ09_35370 [Archangium sp.]|uniref:hypothetical protein n=1 Tax=Archangium sp. TaxID=1872627 RepID=UPI002E3709A5|nr:hypothetical protein [Archangium sp.]HEX5751557.1 hypothetical protein [Archangium sp.]
MARKNAVERRLELLHDQWTEFAQQPEARLLRWVVEPDEVRMVEAFVRKEEDERTGECPDLFMRFDEPFEDAERYGHSLREAMVKRLEESRAGLEKEGAVWQCPPVVERDTGLESFLRACGSLRHHYEGVCEHLVAVLVPARVEEANAWRKWLGGAVQQLQGPHVRLVVLDDARTRELEPLAKDLPGKIVTVAARLDMARAMEELSQEAGHLDTPGGRFRDLLVRMSTAATKGDVGKVERLGEQAVALAREQGWHPLAVAAHFVVGGALLGTKRHQEALAHYQKAEDAATEAQSQGDTQGAILRLKSRMGRGCVQVTAEQYPQAAVLYEESAPLACELKDALMELECWRMASWCWEMSKEWEQAWACGRRAWEVGLGMEARARAGSTLPFLGEALVRLSQQRQGESTARQMESEVVSVLGEDWRPKTSAVGGQHA